MSSEFFLKDTIPRASIQQLLTTIQFIASNSGDTTFEQVRTHLLASSARKAPNTRTALWTVARDVLAEIARLQLGSVGVLPRKLSDVARYADTPARLSIPGLSLAQKCNEKIGRAYDELFVLWFKEHHYFRRLVIRLLRGPLFVPDVTSITQVGIEAVKGTAGNTIGAALIENCVSRLAAVGVGASNLDVLRVGISRRLSESGRHIEAASDAKQLIDLIQDTIVLPAFLESEALPFDPVTFQQLVRCSQEFFSAAWTASLPGFSGRVVFQTCEYDAPLAEDPNARLSRLVHHGVAYAAPSFPDALRSAYQRTAAGLSGYVSAYSVRALVCTSLNLPLPVFGRCLERLLPMARDEDFSVYTELPFESPPQGEEYVEVNGRRIGRLKLAPKIGA
jgi:hypothetical protein